MPIDNALVELISGQHPARKMTFEELYEGLLDNVEKGLISRGTKDDLEIFNYTPVTMFEKDWNIFTLISRGLILSSVNKRVVATPFPKFFNYGEVDIWDAETCVGDVRAFEKLDGSLGIVYYHCGAWHCATRGSFTSEQALWAKKWLDTHIDTEVLNVDHTYLFEIIYPENRIVVPYDYEGLVFLSAYCRDGYEYNVTQAQSLTDVLGIRRAVTFPYVSMNHFVEQANEIDKHNEGWIIRFANGHRVKVKGDEYCRIHRLISNVTPLGVWNIMLAQDDVEMVRRDLPEEHLRDFDEIKQILDARLRAMLEDIKSSVLLRKDMSDKDIGLAMSEGHWPDGKRVEELDRKFLFVSRRLDLDTELQNNKSRVRLTLYKCIKPKSNILDGYVPSRAINRFKREASQG